MNDLTRFLATKGKYHTKADLRFFSESTLEEQEQASKQTWDYAYLDTLDRRGEIDLDNPPAVWTITFQRWLLKKYGLKWLFNYLNDREYKDKPERIPPRLEAIGIPKDEIDAIVNEGAELIKIKVVGVTFGTRQKALERLTYYAPEEVLTVLVPEPENPYDKNAIAVKVFVDGTKESYCIGYIPKTETSKIMPFVSKLPELKIIWGDTFNAELKIAV